MNVIYTILKTVCNIVFDVAVYTIVLALLLYVSGVDTCWLNYIYIQYIMSLPPNIWVSLMF